MDVLTWSPDGSEVSTTPTKGRSWSHTSVNTMRELHKVTTERDQLRFELDKVGSDDAVKFARQ